MRRIGSISGFFNENLTVWKISVPKRLLVPLLIVLVAKIAGAAFIYSIVNVQSLGTFWTDPTRLLSLEQNRVLLENAGSAGNLPYVFVGWDSAWYLSIMTRGYAFSPQSYAFSPGLPFFGGMFNFFLQNPVVSIALCALVFGVLWVPLYQLLTEKYVSRQAALGLALLFAFSPYVFVFTTVAYSEGIFLFFTLSAWYLFTKGKVAYASVLAAIAALTRIVGILVIVPMLYGSLRQKGTHRRRNVALSLLPISALLLWLAYCQLTAGNWFASFSTTQWSGLYSFRSLLFEAIPQKGVDALLMVPYQNWPTPPQLLLPAAIICALAIPPFLIWKAAKTDKSLALYSLVTYVGVLFFGALVSTPRFFSVLFPLWIPLTAGLSGSKKSTALVSIVAAVFYAVALYLWISFLNGEFIS